MNPEALWHIVGRLHTTVTQLKTELQGYGELKETVASLQQDLKECRRELDTLAAISKSASKNDEEAARQLHSSKKSQVPQSGDHSHQHQHKGADLEPINYAEAFARDGGQEAVDRFSAMSKTLQDDINNPKIGDELEELLSEKIGKRKGFSTVLLNQNYVNRLETLYQEAHRVYPMFAKTVNDIAAATNGKAVVPPIKGKKRARMKAMFKYADPEGDGIAWYRLTDLVRASITYPDISTMYEAIEHVIKYFTECDNEDTSSRVREFNDRYQRSLPGGYRDIQMVVQFQDHMCELQLNTYKMIQAKETMGHRSFEVIRELKAAIGAGDLERVVNALEFGREHLGASNSSVQESSTEESKETDPKMDGLRLLLRGENAKTLIHDAAKAGYAEILHALIINGADVNCRDSKKNTPLHHAVFRGSERCVWVILDSAEPDLDAMNDDGETPLVKGYLLLWTRPPENMVRAVTTLAQYAGLERMQAAREKAELLIDEKVQNSRPLVQHAQDGDVQSLRELLTEFKSPDSVMDGKYAIEAAIEGSHLGAIDLLVTFGAELGTREGKLPLIEQAIMTGDMDVVRALQAAGAPIQGSAFQLAIDSRNMEALKTLLGFPGIPFERFEVWLPDSEDVADFVALSARLKRRIYHQVHCTSDYKYITVKEYKEDFGQVVLSLNTSNYPHIAMSEDNLQDGKIYEFALGIGGPSELRIRHSNMNIMTKEVRASADCCKEGEFRAFRITFDPNILKIERYEHSGNWLPFMELDRSSKYQEIKYCRVAAYMHEADYRIALSPMEEAIICGNREALDTLLASGASLYPSGGRDPPVARAIAAGDLEIAQKLLAAGAVVDSRDFQKAIDTSNSEALRLLMELSSIALGTMEVWMDMENKDEALVEATGEMPCYLYKSFHTPDEYFYQTVKTFDGDSGHVIFAVKSHNYAHVALTQDETQGGEIYEINLTQDGSSQLRIRNDLNSVFLKPAECYNETVKEGEFRSFRLSFDPDSIKIERYSYVGSWELMMEMDRNAWSPRYEIRHCRVAAHAHPADWRIKVD